MRMMQTYDSFKNNNLLNLDNIQSSALYLLAAPSTPDTYASRPVKIMPPGVPGKHKG